MFSIRKSSVENNNNMFLNNLMNHDVQKKSEFKNTSNSKFGCFISSVKNKLDSINEMICRKKIIRSNHSVVEAIEIKSANNDISEKSLRKIKCKIKKMNENYSFLETVDIKKEIISKTKSANKPVQDKISAMLDREFGINVYHRKENLNSEIK